MAVKSAAVLARMEPELKEQAEDILEQLGIPASVLITCLYKQIVYTRSIPFSLSLPPKNVDFDRMTEAELGQMLELGVAEAEKGYGISAQAAFEGIRSKRNGKKL